VNRGENSAEKVLVVGLGVSGRAVCALLRDRGAAHVIRNQRNGHVLADRLLPAFDSKSRRAGLLGYESLEIGHAMLIAPSNAIHTFFMRFPIDIAFVTRGGRVVKTRASVRPWRMALAMRAYAVIELPAGTLARCDTVPGDTLAITPATIV
jgi:uncharacterized membrane protein (UPF0127 family)